MPRSSSRAAEAAGGQGGGGGAPLDARGVEPLLGYLIALAETQTRRLFQRAIGDPLGLRPVEFTLLALLRDNGSATPKQFGSALRLPAPHVTTLIDRLAERGLVERQPHPDDRRAVRIVLTAAGVALAVRAGEAAQTMEAPLLEVLTPAELARLQRLLLKLVRAEGS